MSIDDTRPMDRVSHSSQGGVSGVALTAGLIITVLLIALIYVLATSQVDVPNRMRVTIVKPTPPTKTVTVSPSPRPTATLFE